MLPLVFVLLQSLLSPEGVSVKINRSALINNLALTSRIIIV